MESSTRVAVGPNRRNLIGIFVQNLDCSGANQAIYYLLLTFRARLPAVVFSPAPGPFAQKLKDIGAIIEIGDFSRSCLKDISGFSKIICNTIMTAHIVYALRCANVPVIWIIHEWWTPSMIEDNFKLRKIEHLNVTTVQKALDLAQMIVFVSDKQQSLYNHSAPSVVIPVGAPFPDCYRVPWSQSKPFTILVAGIICPRKNQIMAARIFKKFAVGKQDVRLIIVGARYCRDYEISYLSDLKKEVADCLQISIVDVCEKCEEYYQIADVILLTSLNEVTPLVITEGLSWGIPIVSTSVGGISEMIQDGKQGFLIDSIDISLGVERLNQLYYDSKLRFLMCMNCQRRFFEVYTHIRMGRAFDALFTTMNSPVILVDMDGVLVDWDAGFREMWGDLSIIAREKSYFMEECVEKQYKNIARDVFHSKGFFRNLPAMDGAIEAIREMRKMHLNVMICTSPIISSSFCIQEKIDWIRTHFDEEMLGKTIVCSDKSLVFGDILIDDKPISNNHNASWKHVVFDAPYNQNCTGPRIKQWSEWKIILGYIGIED